MQEILFKETIEGHVSRILAALSSDIAGTLHDDWQHREGLDERNQRSCSHVCLETYKAVLHSICR